MTFGRFGYTVINPGTDSVSCEGSAPDIVYKADYPI